MDSSLQLRGPVVVWHLKGSEQELLQIVRGQPFPVTMDVECSRTMRKLYPVGTRFCIYAKEASREAGKPFLYSHFDWPFEVIDPSSFPSAE